MFKRTKVCSGVVVALGGVLVLTGGSSLAQTTAPTAAPSGDRVEITGSLIRRIDGESALPVTILRAEDLARSGATNAEGIVNFITQAQGSTVTSSSVSGTNGAAAFADLRSLGSQRTLVLLNGKRVVQNPFATAGVDLNTLPTSAIERVEVLSDGASATYGTDAIAGVINFITRRSYTGFSIEGQTQLTQEGGGKVNTGGLLGGFGNLATDGFNVFGSVNYRKQNPLNGLARDFMSSSYQPDRGFNGLSGTTFPGNYSQTNSGTNPALNIAVANPSLATGCSPLTSIRVPEPNGSFTRCFADTQTFTNVIPDQEQYGIFVKGTKTLGADHSASLEYFKANNKVQSQIAPSPETGLTVTPASPFFPGRGITPASTNANFNPNNNISAGWRTTVLGSRQGEQENNTQRTVASLEGAGFGFDYNASVLWSKSAVQNFFLNGYPQTAALRNGTAGCATAVTAAGCPPGQALTSNGSPLFLNPFGNQTAAGLAYLQANQVLGKVQDGEALLKSVVLSGSRSFGRLPGGPISLALGAEYREEEMVYNTDIPKVSQAASSGLAGSGARRAGDRDIKAAVAELAVPVFRWLEIGAGVRYDDYSDFGSTTNPKVSLKLTPIEWLVLRGSVNTGFSAPTLYQLYLPNSTTFTGNRYNDPVLCPNGNPIATAQPARDCGLQFQQLQGGNAGLTAEESKSYTVGFVLEPMRGLSVSLDYWNTEVEGQVSTVGEQTIFGNPSKYSAFFVRCSQAPADRRAALGACQNPGASDPLAYILNTFANLGDIKSAGVDVELNYASPATPFGRFNASLRGSYITKYDFQVEPGGQFFDPVGNYSAQFGGPVIRYQQLTRVGWERDAVSVALIHRFKSGYIDQNIQGAPFNVAPFNTNRVDRYNQFDASVQFKGFKGITLSAAVLNIADEDPPFSNQTGRFQARGYDDRFYTPLGRTYQLGAKYEF